MKKEIPDSIETIDNGDLVNHDSGECTSNKVFRFASHEMAERAKKNAFREWAAALDYLRDK